MPCTSSQFSDYTEKKKKRFFKKKKTLLVPFGKVKGSSKLVCPIYNALFFSPSSDVSTGILKISWRIPSLIYSPGLEPFPADPHFKLIFALSWKKITNFKVRYPSKDIKFSIFGKSLGGGGEVLVEPLASAPHMSCRECYLGVSICRKQTGWAYVYQP